jgi:signal transduction histidine kinase
MEQRRPEETRGIAANTTWFLPGTGEISTLLKTIDHRSPLGSPMQWSPSLKTLMATTLPVHAQIVIFWGPHYVALYNDAYAPTIGDKHPGALGRPAVEHWAELWDDLEPLLRGVRETGQTFSAKDRPFYIKRSERGETVYFDVSYSAVREQDGSVGGVLCIVTETTQRVQFERRQAFLVELGKALPSFNDPDVIQAHVLRQLGNEFEPETIRFAVSEDDGETFERRRSYERGRLFRDGEIVKWDSLTLGQLRAGYVIFHHESGARSGMPAPDIFDFLEHEPPARVDIPVIHHGKLTAVMSIRPAALETFGGHHLRLTREVAELTWLWINHAKGERDLRKLNEELEERVVSIVGEREQVLAQLHESRKMEMVGQIGGGIAHDFNNLLTPIMASLELIGRRVDDNGTQRLVKGAQQAAERARALVGKLLTFARRQTLKPESVSLAHIVGELKDLVERSLGSGISLDIAMPDGLPKVRVDPQQLELALLNLAVNARDAMPEGGRLTIAAAAQCLSATRGTIPAGRYVSLTVADTGCGMTQDILQSCVEPFYSTKGAGKGTGLGLSMVQGLAVQTGGGLDITSRPGEGTRITLWLPLADLPRVQT